MRKMTSAGANKLLRKLREDRDFWDRKEDECQIYIAAADEAPVVPEYDYEETAGKIAKIDDEILRIKHAINQANVSHTISVKGREMTIDTVLVRMAQLSGRKAVLGIMRSRQPKSRVNDYMSVRKAAPEYQYINYDLETVNSEYEKVDSEIMEMQIELDRYNQTVMFDVDM